VAERVVVERSSMSAGATTLRRSGGGVWGGSAGGRREVLHVSWCDHVEAVSRQYRPVQRRPSPVTQSASSPTHRPAAAATTCTADAAAGERRLRRDMWQRIITRVVATSAISCTIYTYVPGTHCIMSFLSRLRLSTLHSARPICSTLLVRSASVRCWCFVKTINRYRAINALCIRAKCLT